jgi:hypothetical protein
MVHSIDTSRRGGELALLAMAALEFKKDRIRTSRTATPRSLC